MCGKVEPMPKITKNQEIMITIRQINGGVFMSAPNGNEYVCSSPEEISEAIAEILCTPQPAIKKRAAVVDRDEDGDEDLDVGPKIRKKGAAKARAEKPEVIIVNEEPAQAAPPPNISAFDNLLIDAGLSIFHGLQRASAIATPPSAKK